MRQQPQPRSLDDLAEEAVRLGRQVARDVRTLSVGRGTHEHAFARRCLARLEAGQPFDVRDEGNLDAVASILDDEIKRETLGHERVFRGFVTPEGEAIGDVETVARLTEHGKRVAALHETFARFRRVRTSVLDRVAAERCLQRLLQA